MADRRPLPADTSEMKMYEVCGQTIFPVYASSGALSPAVAAFPYIMRGKYKIVYGHYLGGLSMQHLGRDEYEVQMAHDAKFYFAQALKSGKSVRTCKGIGPMPENGEIVRFTGPERVHGG